MALPTGSKAPAFSLKTKTADGLKDVALADTLGKKQTVLLFFPLVYTSVCTAEMCSVSQDLASFNGLNAAVYGISVDSPFAQEAWAKANNINFPLLSDFNKEVAKAYDVLYADFLPARSALRAWPSARPSSSARTASSNIPRPATIRRSCPILARFKLH